MTFNEGLSPKDYACLVIPNLDYESQLYAIRDLINLHIHMEEHVDSDLKAMKDSEEKYGNLKSDNFITEWEQRVHESVYQSAAYSMAAVGMLSPLMESLFTHAFEGIREKFFSPQQDNNQHKRWEYIECDKWNCHIAWGTSGRKDDLVRGILQLSDAIGLKPFLPSDIEHVLEALFSYRNRMFHHGFEWPLAQRQKYWKRINSSRWDKSWFIASTTNEEPWIIYLTDMFISHCISTIENIIESIGAYVLFQQENSQTKMST